MDLDRQDSTVDESKRSCSTCGTEKTPLWRCGPAGPKSLCNACGIKHRKRNILMSKQDKKKPSQSTDNNPSVSSLSSSSGETLSKSKPKLNKSSLSKSKVKLEKSSSSNLQQSKNVSMAAFSEDMVLVQRQRLLKRQRSEEEEAALLLMSLSRGYVFS